MRAYQLPIIVLAAALSSGTARAQTVLGAAGGDLKNALGDMWGVWTSPFRASGRDWLTAGGVLAFSVAVSPFDDDVDRFVAARPHSALWSPLKELRQGGAVFSGQSITPVALGLWATGLAINNRSIRDGVMGCGAAYAASSVVRTQLVYRVLERRRPDSSHFHSTTAPPAQQGDQYDFRAAAGEWGMQSAPGGHVANVAACASFLGSRFHLGFVEPLLYLAVAGVGIGRIADRGHWMSDQVLGVLFGYAVGREVGRRSLDRVTRERRAAVRPDSAGAATASSAARRAFYVSPAPGGIAFGWRATF